MLPVVNRDAKVHTFSERLTRKHDRGTVMESAYRVNMNIATRVGKKPYRPLLPVVDMDADMFKGLDLSYAPIGVIADVRLSGLLCSHVSSIHGSRTGVKSACETCVSVILCKESFILRCAAGCPAVYAV
jgi:hypothetical protein